jgi:hypothetical protein
VGVGEAEVADGADVHEAGLQGLLAAGRYGFLLGAAREHEREGGDEEHRQDEEAVPFHLGLLSNGNGWGWMMSRSYPGRPGGCQARRGTGIVPGPPRPFGSGDHRPRNDTQGPICTMQVTVPVYEQSSENETHSM